MARLFKDMSLEELRDHARRASTYYGVVQNYIEALEAECFKLAAGACEHRGGNEHGNPYCTLHGHNI